MTKQQVINKVKDLIEDINALWHWCKCLEEQVNKQKQEISKLNEDMYKVQEASKSNT
jgi:peptidoglycan hydrolase CwlO-like protein